MSNQRLQAMRDAIAARHAFKPPMTKAEADQHAAKVRLRRNLCRDCKVCTAKLEEERIVRLTTAWMPTPSIAERMNNTFLAKRSHAKQWLRNITENTLTAQTQTDTITNVVDNSLPF